MDNSPCFQCNMYVANQFSKFQDGPYKRMFCIQENQANKEFIKNQMSQEKCKNMASITCFDLVNGASTCLPCNNDILTYDIQGNLIKRKYLYY